METMKIVAGLGSIDDYVPFANAGADEVFIGHVPGYWQLAYGPESPLNRREVSFYNVQAGPQSELEILAGMVEACGVPVTIAVNSPGYQPQHFPVICQMLEECKALGFGCFIVADPALPVFLKAEEPDRQYHFHASGDMGELNHYLLPELARLSVSRVIFPRHTSLEDMASLIACGPQGMEYEAFALNECCHFTGAWCSCLHSDCCMPLCRAPYRLKERGTETEEEGSQKLLTALNGGERDVLSCGEPDCVGSSGCALCALWRLREAGVTHLKLVGRGGQTESLLRDIRSLRLALNLLEQADGEEDYVKAMKESLFPEGCSHTCYYAGWH